MTLVTADGTSVVLDSHLLSLAEYTERSNQLKELLQKARDSEADAFKQLKGIQEDILLAMANNDQNSLALRESTYVRVEEAWRRCVLYTAELRAEMQDLCRERHGDDAEEELRDMESHRHSKTVHVTASIAEHRSAGGRGLPLSLEKTKVVPIRADDVSPCRRSLIQSAFPDVDPCFTNDENLPIGEVQLQRAFDQLDRERKGYLSLRVTIDYFDTHDRIGTPTDRSQVAKFIGTNLARFNPTLRRAMLRGGITPEMECDPAFKVTFEAFAFLMLKWAQN